MRALDGHQTALFLDETGLAFEINRRILNPLGLSLSTSEHGVILSQTEALEGVVMTATEMETGVFRHKRMMAREGQRRIKARREALGYAVQGEGDPPSQRATPRH